MEQAGGMNLPNTINSRCFMGIHRAEAVMLFGDIGKAIHQIA